jgi:hypothetical protein
MSENDYITLTCWQLGTDPMQTFRVEVKANFDLIRLQEAIQRKHSNLVGHLNPQNLGLWTVGRFNDQ